MSSELGDILSRLPSDKKLTQEACEFLNKEIRRGVDLNLLQREGVFAVVQVCLEHGLKLPAPYESFWAYVYQEWSDEAKTSEEVKKKLAKLVQTIKASAALAPVVAQTVQQMQRNVRPAGRRWPSWRPPWPSPQPIRHAPPKAPLPHAKLPMPTSR